MPDFEKLMQTSETMRMLKIGNPERSKDFGVPELQSGLFELERQTKANLENLIYTSPDPNGSIIKHDTALMLNNLGLDMETSRKLAEGGFASAATGIDTRSKSYGDALITKAQHAYWNEMRGVNASLYRVTGNPEFLKNAQEYDGKVFQNPVFESFGKFGDLTLDSVQPAISSAKFLLTNAILSWIPGGVTNKVWGPAVAKLVAKGGGIAATGVNFISTGYSQAGNVLYDVMQMQDGEGNTLPWDSPVGGILFHSLAGLMGLVELGSMEMFPWYKQLKSRFTSREVAEYLKKGIAKSLLDVTFKGAVGTGAESIEEGLQSGLEDGFSNALKALANKDGADFELISLGDSVKKGTKALWDAGKSMFLTSFLSAGVGQGVYASKVRIESAKNFKKSDASQSIDASFLGVSRTAIAEAKAEETKKGEEAKGNTTDTKETKFDPIKVVNVGPRLSPVNDEELKKAAQAIGLGAQAVEIEVVEMPGMADGDRMSLVNRAAIASGGKLIDGDSLGFEDEKALNRALYLIAPSVESVETTPEGKTLVLRNEGGELTRISMQVMGENIDAARVTDPDITYAEDPEAPYALSRMSEERALEWEERNLIRNALGDVTTHTKGKISSADVEASIDAIKTIAETLDMPTDKLLSDGLVIHLTDKVQDEWGRDALGSITSNITIDGKKQYTINLSKKANVSTVLHELGHLLRGFATKEQLAEFRKYYGDGEEAAFLEDINLVDGKYHVGTQVFNTIEEASKYVTGNEERFADDYVAYMLTGEAPTEGLKNIFRRMKAVLHRFITQYGNRLTPEVKQAFDNLIAGKQVAAGVNATAAQSADASTLFQLETNGSEFTEIYNRYIDTDQWLKAPNGNPTNLTDHQWVMVRTRGFTKWFGDWLNHPEDASKTLDENGEPAVLYHGSSFEQITEFMDGGRGIIYMTDDLAVAKDYADGMISSQEGDGSRVYELFGRIMRPAIAQDQRVIDILYDRWKLSGDTRESIIEAFDEGYDPYLLLEDQDVIQALMHAGYDGVEFYEGASMSYGVFSPTQIKSVANIGSFGTANENILFQHDVLPADSKWTLFQLETVESVVTVRDNAPKAVRVYEVSMQPEEMHKLFGEDKPANLEIQGMETAREMNSNPTRQADWQQIYAKAMTAKGKNGSDLKFSDMRKVNKDGKLMSVPVIALTKGCQRAQVTVERVQNGVLPNETNIEACYGGTCWVNRQFNSKFSAFENMEVRDLLMPTPDDINKWFKKPSIKQFLTSGPFIREGQMGDSSHAFPILDGYGVSLAETWLKNIREVGIKQKTVFITAAYAPVSVESYERLLPYKDLFEIHVSISGWFHKNELMIRLAEFETIRNAGLPVSFRIVTNKDGISGLDMPNQVWLDQQLAEMSVSQNEVLETPYHDDGVKKGQKRSEPTGAFKFICCETGKCLTCSAKCMTKIEHLAPEMTSYERISIDESSPAVSTELMPSGTSAIPQTQPSDEIEFITADATKQLTLQREIKEPNSNILFQRMDVPGTKEFEAFYKGSVLVDKEGNPLKLYHGTASLFTKFDRKFGSMNMGDKEGSEGFFFTTDKDEAITYAGYAVSPEIMAYRDEYDAVLRKMRELGVRRDSDHALADKLLELEQKITEAEDLIDRGAQAWDPVVAEGYVRITNPAIIDLADPDINGEIDFQQLIQEAKASGHDGFIYKNVNLTDEMHVVAFTDSQVGAIGYSLFSEGYEMDHEFPAEVDSEAESVIDYRGHKVIPHDLGMDYSKENLDAIIEEVDDELRQITLYQPQEEGELYPLDVSTGKRLTKKQKGHKDNAYTNIWGWDGSEEHPSIVGDWSKFRKLDLEGAILRDVKDVAKLFSIYRNPFIEFFHIIYIREMADGTIKVKGHHAMTSGAPGFTVALSRRFPRDIAECMKKYRATGYYLMHNHPSGNISPSVEDRRLTSRYLMNADGLMGHIILDHDKFTLIDDYLHWGAYENLKGFHQVPARTPLYNSSFSTPEELGVYGIRIMGSRQMLVMYLDNQHRLVHAQPIETLDIDEIYENVEKNLYFKVVLVTSNKKLYQEALDADRYARVFKGEAFLDIVLYHTNKKDGSITITSALGTGQLANTGNDFWHTQYTRKRGVLPGNDNYVFEHGKTLYQLSDEARKRVVESRKQDVKNAVEQYYWIPDDVLQEYVGEDWADREIRFRTRLKENPWVLEEAREYTDPDEYLEFVSSRDTQDGKGSSDAAIKWWRRVYEYARVESAAERNLRFVREHTSTDKDLIALGNRLRSYIETDQETGKRYFRWGTFKGVSPLVKSLTANSPSEDIQKARALVADKPEPYRKALLKIAQAERVVDNEGKFYLPTKEEREAYYDSLGEEMSDALNEPLLINQMADKENAEFLDTSDNPRGRYSAREKMATHNGVLEIDAQADKELADLRAEYGKKVENLTELRKRFDMVTKEINKLGDELKETRKDRNRLKSQLKDTRETAVNLRSALSEKREGYRRLERERAALEKKFHAVRTRRDLERYHKAILASAKFNPNSVDASYEEALNTIHDLFRQDYKEGGYKMLPEMLTRYLDDQSLWAIKENQRIGDWSLDKLVTLYYAIRAMKTDARVMLERKRVERSGRLQNLAIKYYDQLYGEFPEIDPLVGGVMGSIMEELSIKQKKYQEGMFGAIWNTVAGSVIHSQRLARIIDGNREGVMYDLLVRRAYENSSKELSHSFERLEAAEAKMRELGVTDKSLRKDLYTYTTIAGDEITLTRGEVLGLYVYGQNELGMEKLIMPWGNGIQPGQLAEAVGKLTDAEKAWGDYMIDGLGGDDPWERMRDVFYNVYNKNLGKRKRYFTFVAEGNLNEGNTDMLNGPKGRPVRYTDKGMTEKVVPHARYALKLDVTYTYTQQVKRQEHFIAWAEWVRDLNYLLSNRGSIGAMIEANHGSKLLSQVQDFVNDIGSPQIILDDIERLGNKILSNAAVGALSFNALTPLKQLASLSAVVRGDIDISSLFHAARRLGNPAIHDDVVKMIHEKSPKMKDRTFDVEVAKYVATEFDTEVGVLIQAINEKVGMKAIAWTDQLVANLIWLSAYDTALKKGATDAEAAFRATEVVGETQSSTNVSDLSSLQRKKNPWLRAVLMFTNDIVQHINQIWFDVPYFVRTKQYRKAFGTLANLALAGAISMLVSGKLFRDGDDDEEYLKRIGKEILEIIVSDTIPIVGNSVASGVNGWGGGDMVDLPSAFGRFIGSATDGDGDRMLKSFTALVEAGLKVWALPVTAGNRAVKAVREQNPLHLLNHDYAELWEGWL